MHVVSCQISYVKTTSVFDSHSLMDNIWYVYVQVHELLQIYNEHDVLSERLLFKIPATWQVSMHSINLLSFVFFMPADSIHLCHQLAYNQGIEASRLLESEGTQTHLTFVYRYIVVLCLIWLTIFLVVRTCMDVFPIFSFNIKQCCAAWKLFLFPNVWQEHELTERWRGLNS